MELFQLGEEKVPGRPSCGLAVPKGGYRKDGEEESSSESAVIEQGVVVSD